jgi:hypothetical protein
MTTKIIIAGSRSIVDPDVVVKAIKEDDVTEKKMYLFGTLHKSYGVCNYTYGPKSIFLMTEKEAVETLEDINKSRLLVDQLELFEVTLKEVKIC